MKIQNIFEKNFNGLLLFNDNTTLNQLLMTTKEKQDIVVAVYRKALGMGVCRTVKEFSELLDMNVSGISSALNGSERHLTDSLVRKVQRWETQYLNGEGAPKPKRPDVVIPAETLDLYNNMARTIADLSDILRRAGIIVGNGLNIQKNYLRDDK